jgi:hypothetical protein
MDLLRSEGVDGIAIFSSDTDPVRRAHQGSWTADLQLSPPWNVEMANTPTHPIIMVRKRLQKPRGARDGICAAITRL